MGLAEPEAAMLLVAVCAWKYYGITHGDRSRACVFRLACAEANEERLWLCQTVSARKGAA